MRSRRLKPLAKANGSTRRDENSLDVSADDQKEGKYSHCFSDIQPPGSSREFGNEIRACHDFWSYLSSRSFHGQFEEDSGWSEFRPRYGRRMGANENARTGGT